MIYDRRDHAAIVHQKAVDEILTMKKEAKKQEKTIDELRARIDELEKRSNRTEEK